MNKERLVFLYRKYKDQTISSGEWAELQQELKNPDSYDLLGEELDSQWTGFTDQQLSEMEPARFDRVYEEIVRHDDNSVRTTKLWPRIVAVAAAIALIVVGVYFFNYNRQTAGNSAALVAQDIAPGKVGATLTLASGKMIRLSDAANGELANEAGISITKTADGQLVYELKGSDADPNKINTLSTAKGETYQVRLPDGSLVYLNAASSLTYAASLIERGKRTVRLRGEGYFEISKDKKHPFVVQTKNQAVEVLGTHFNVNAYEDEPLVKTTLAEGSVKVTAGGKALVLKPNQQATLTAGALSVREVDAELALAWKSGFFLFEEENLESVMTKLGRWYNVEVVYNDPSLKARTFTGTISRFEKISQVFTMLERTGVVKFKIDGKTITVDRIK